MSRSRKHTPITSIAKCRSATSYKRIRAGEERARLRAALYQAKRVLGEQEDDGDLDEVSDLGQEFAPWNEWACPRDGKQWLHEKPGERWDADAWAACRAKIMRKK